MFSKPTQPPIEPQRPNIPGEGNEEVGPTNPIFGRQNKHFQEKPEPPPDVPPRSHYDYTKPPDVGGDIEPQEK